MPIETSESPARAEAPVWAGDPATPGLVEQVRMLVTGGVSSRELVELSLDRTEAAQRDLNAFRVIRAAEALAEAEAADRRLSRGECAPLLGVPVAIKDDVDLAGETTPFGCSGDRRTAGEDAEVVKRLRSAGAIVIGKTHAPEVGQWHFTESPRFGATRNPWHLGHTPGGSSGGGAAAVAAGLVAAAVGSDGAGSIRIPAAWTGLVGLKPQRGRVSTWPEPEPFNGLTCFGPLARSVADAALLLDAIHGNLPADPHRPARPRGPTPSAPPASRGALRVALSFATPAGVPSEVDAEHRRAVEERSPRCCARLGHEVTPADPDYGLVGASLIPRGMAGVHAWLRENVEDRSELEPRTRAHARVGRLLCGRAAAPRARRRAVPAPPPRPHLRSLRRRPHPDHREAAAARSAPWPAAATGRPARRPAPPARSGSPGTWSAGRRSACPPVEPATACRSAPSCSAPKATRRPCSASPARWSGCAAAGRRRPTRAAPGRPARSRRSWRPRWTKPARVRPVARWLRSSSYSRSSIAGPHRVDRHPHLHPVARGERQYARAAASAPHRPLAGDRRRRSRTRRGGGSPSGRSRARRRSPPPTRRLKAATARSHSPRRDRLDERRRAGRGGAKVAVAEQDEPGRRLDARAPPRRRRSRWRPCRAGGRG